MHIIKILIFIIKEINFFTRNIPALLRANNCVSETFLVSSGNDEISSRPVVPLLFTNLLFRLSNVTFIAIGIFGKLLISIATEIASQIDFKDSEIL